jgi:hypothetical protein
MRFWQVAAGERSRDYSSVFTDFGVMLVGSGDPGPFFEQESYYRGHRDWRSQIVRFAERVEPGDMVVLKKPHGTQWEIAAVGVVKGKYECLNLFEDVEGWDLQHCRRVEWVKPPSPTYVKGLSRGTFVELHKSAIQKKASELLKVAEPVKVKRLPQVANEVSYEELVDGLVDGGLRAADAEILVRTIGYVRRLARWYKDHGRNISEHETRTFLIVPVLLALGWSEQKMKIEWNNLDIAFFSRAYDAKATTEDCIMILESKRMREGLSYAERQVKDYQAAFPNCSRLIVSDGVCYRLYQRQNDLWEWEAYLNLLKLKDRHPYYTKIKGALDVFLSLMPA